MWRRGLALPNTTRKNYLFHRKLSILDTILKDPAMKERLKDPKAVESTVASINSALNDKGLTGTLLRNSPLKGLIDSIGGMENLEKLTKDPKFMESMKQTLADPNPEMKKRADEIFAGLMKNQDVWPKKSGDK